MTALLEVLAGVLPALILFVLYNLQSWLEHMDNERHARQAWTGGFSRTEVKVTASQRFGSEN